MNSYQKKQTFEKCCNIVLSCKTKAQLKVAEKYCDLFIKKIEARNIKILLKNLIQNHSINCI